MSGWGSSSWGALSGGSGSTESVPPTIGNFNIAPGTAISRDQAIAFDVTDNASLAFVGLAASYADGSVDLVYDGHDFRGRYTGTVVAISGGYRFTVWRSGGWPSAPTFEYLPIDTSGNLGVLA